MRAAGLRASGTTSREGGNEMSAVSGAAVAERAVGRFRAWHGAEPEGVWHAPGRANLIGEHTDYNEGWVLPFALDRGVVVAARRRGDEVLDIRSHQADGPVTVPLAALRAGSVTGWAAYPAGVAWALRESGHAVGGASLVIDSDLPQGAGLSSSAAIECATAVALVALYQVSVSRPELAGLARRAENEMVGVPSGIMDQSASLLCEAGHALLLDCRTGDSAPVRLDPAAAGLALLLVDTGARHALTDGRYALRRAECEQAARALGVPSLRDVADPARAADIGDPVLARRARHVITDNCRVRAAVDLLNSGDLAGLGPLLHASHASLRDDFEVSWPQADVAAEAAEAAGGLGARMMGGGFGGSVIALVPADTAGPREAIAAEYASRGWPTPRFLPAPPSAGAGRLL
jgi:galactokinase